MGAFKRNSGSIIIITMGTLVSREMFCVELSGTLAVRFVLDTSQHLELYLSNSGKRAADDKKRCCVLQSLVKVLIIILILVTKNKQQ